MRFLYGGAFFRVYLGLTNHPTKIREEQRNACVHAYIDAYIKVTKLNRVSVGIRMNTHFSGLKSAVSILKKKIAF